MGSGVKVKPYTYKLDEPVGGTFVKLGLRNNPDAQAAQPDKIKPVTGISEVMLKGITQSVDGPNATAKLTEVKFNGVALPQEALDEGRYVSKDGEVKELTAVAADNAAVTIVGAYKGVAHVIVQSEDHKTTKTLVIVLEGWKPEPGDQPTVPGDQQTVPGVPDNSDKAGEKGGEPETIERRDNPDSGSSDSATGKSTLNATAPGVVSGKLSRTGAESVTLILFAVFAVLAGTVVVRWSARRE